VPTDSPKSFVCPKEHVDQARAFIQNCQDFLLIGFSGRDEDVIGLLREVPSNSRLEIISKGDARTICRRVSSGIEKAEVKKVILFPHGISFSRFTGDKVFDRFLGAGSIPKSKA
jgi:hypothetical protein